MTEAFEAPSAGFLALLEQQLGSFSDEQLTTAKDEIIRTRRYKSFPPIADCVAACRAQVVYREPTPDERRAAERLAEAKRASWHRRACDRIKCTTLGDTALKGRWLHGLIDFVKEHDRMPDEGEQEQLAATARGIEDNLRALRDLPKNDPLRPNPYKALAAWRRKMIDRAERDIFGEITEKAPVSARPLDWHERQRAEAQERLNEMEKRASEPLPQLSVGALIRSRLAKQPDTGGME